jgi:hypothetical protein
LNGTTCETCPVGAICTENRIDRIAPGFWIPPDSDLNNPASIQFYTCSKRGVDTFLTASIEEINAANEACPEVTNFFYSSFLACVNYRM